MLRSAEFLFSKRKVWFLLLEFDAVQTRRATKGGHPQDLLKHVAALGFRISPVAFTGEALLLSLLLLCWAETGPAHDRPRLCKGFSGRPVP